MFVGERFSSTRQPLHRGRAPRDRGHRLRAATPTQALPPSPAGATGEARRSWTVGKGLHHICTTSEGQMRLKAVNRGQPDLVSDQRLCANPQVDTTHDHDLPHVVVGQEAA